MFRAFILSMTCFAMLGGSAFGEGIDWGAGKPAAKMDWGGVCDCGANCHCTPGQGCGCTSPSNEVTLEVLCHPQAVVLFDGRAPNNQSGPKRLFTTTKAGTYTVRCVCPDGDEKRQVRLSPGHNVVVLCGQPQYTPTPIETAYLGQVAAGSFGGGGCVGGS